MMSYLLQLFFFDIISIGAWQTVYAMLSEIFNDVRTYNFKFSQKKKKKEEILKFL